MNNCIDALRCFSKNYKLIIIDPEEEYSELAKMLNVKTVKEDGIINPLEIKDN